MTHLLQYFPQLSLRPENLSELRSLILQLAVEGKLTAEWRKANPDVEPASELLARIEAEKAELVKAKQIKKSKPLPPVSAEEMPFELPEGWAWCRLGDVVLSIIGGGTPSKRVAEYWNGEIPWASVKDLKSHKYLSKTRDTITHQGLNNSSANLIPKGQIIICTRMGLGKIAINTVPLAINQDLKAVDISSFIDQEFFFLEYKSRNVVGSGMTVKGIKLEELKSFIYALPPLPEQQAIVQTVDALLQELDQLQQRTEARLQLKADYATAALRRLTTAPAVGPAWEALAPHFRTFFDETGNVQSLRAAILQLAVQGKLTAQWRKAHPGVEPATELLSRIQAEKAALVKAKKIKRSKPLPPVDIDEVPFAVPEGWVWCRLQQVIDVRDGTHDSPKPVQTSDSFPMITSKDFKGGTIDFSKARRISREDYEKIIQRSKVDEYDILFSMIGGNIGNQVIVLGKTNFAIKNVALFKYYSKELIAPYYLKIFTEHLASRLQAEASGGAQPFVSLTYLRKLLFPLPPLPEQHAIVQAVEELLGLCTALEDAAGRRDVVLGDWVRAVVAGG